MQSDMNRGQDLAAVVAKNIAEIRKNNHLTQAALAERLGYSDKSVSKWERGEGVPDVICLKRMADLFGVTVDYFLEECHDGEGSPAMKEGAEEELLQPTRGAYVTNHRAVSLLAVAGVWMVAAILYVILRLCQIPTLIPFVAALPVTALLLIIFHALWGQERGRRLLFFVTVSLLIWSLLFLVCYILRAQNLWLLMILGLPATVVVALACSVKKKAGEENAPEAELD